jgi:hypothetical protein
MVYNITKSTFGTLGTRCGDLIAICNIIEYLRKTKEQHVQFYIPKYVLNQDDYIHKFYDYLCERTDYFSKEEGFLELPFNNVSVWDFRSIIGDHAIIKNPIGNMDYKVVIFPLYDAEYNPQRNWSIEIMNDILNECRTKYPYHRKVICAKEQPPNGLFDYSGFEISTDFITNIHHIETSMVFYGGDTGVSHYASVLDYGPELNYIYSNRCLIHTIPFYCLSERKGNLRTFWLDFMGDAKWDLKLI